MSDEINKPPPPPAPPEEPPTNVIRLIPKRIVELDKIYQQNEAIWMRKAKCQFSRIYSPNGCQCNYCVYLGMMGQRVFEMVRHDVLSQSKQGKMLFCSADMIEILQIALEKVARLEKEQKKNNPPPIE
jgi:hypothetical protein